MLEIKIENGKIFSFIRDKWLICTPEEKVTQPESEGVFWHYVDGEAVIW